MSGNGDDTEVGYGKPPKSTRFKKGQSGNPKGRPKGSRSFDKDLDDVLKAQMTINENGRSRKVSTQLAALMRLKERALKGDPRALARLLTMADERSAEREAHSKERVLSSEEDDILQRFMNSAVNQTDGEGDDNGE